MISITDSNIIFSVLISPQGEIAKILKAKSNIQFIAPDYLLEEVHTHYQKIIKNSSLSKIELDKELSFIKTRIKFINVDNIPDKYIIEAYEIVKDIDIDDTFFVALQRYKHHKIWTGDRVLIDGLKKKGYDICITTAQLKEYIFKK